MFWTPSQKRLFIYNLGTEILQVSHPLCKKQKTLVLLIVIDMTWKSARWLISVVL